MIDEKGLFNGEINLVRVVRSVVFHKIHTVNVSSCPVIPQHFLQASQKMNSGSYKKRFTCLASLASFKSVNFY